VSVMTDMVRRQWHGHMVVVEEYVVQSLTWLDKNCSPWLIDFTDALICFDACPRVCVRVVDLFFFMCNFTEVDKKHHQFWLSECVTVFVTSIVNMDIRKAWLNASENSPNKRVVWSAHRFIGRVS
jgi:hypothetical protein